MTTLLQVLGMVQVEQVLVVAGVGVAGVVLLLLAWYVVAVPGLGGEPL